MRWFLGLLFLILMLGLGCSSKEEPKKPGSEEDISAGFVDPSGGKGKDSTPSEPQETLDRDKPTYPVKEFLTYLKQGKPEKSLEFLTSDSRQIFSAKRLPRIERFYVLDVLKRDDRTIVNSEMRFLFKDTTYRDIRMGWLVQQEGGGWKIYGSETDGFYCFYNNHSLQKSEILALSVLGSLRKKAYYYRLRKGKFVGIDQMVEENFLPKDLKGGNFKEYQYSIELGGTKISILALPKVMLPIHRGFYLDSANIIRYSQDGSIPTGSSEPVIFKQNNPKKKK